MLAWKTHDMEGGRAIPEFQLTAQFLTTKSFYMILQILYGYVWLVYLVSAAICRINIFA
jgi:hypothetical protein